MNLSYQGLVNVKARFALLHCNFNKNEWCIVQISFETTKYLSLRSFLVRANDYIDTLNSKMNNNLTSFKFSLKIWATKIEEVLY